MFDEESNALLLGHIEFWPDVRRREFGDQGRQVRRCRELSNRPFVVIPHLDERFRCLVEPSIWHLRNEKVTDETIFECVGDIPLIRRLQNVKIHPMPKQIQVGLSRG